MIRKRSLLLSTTSLLASVILGSGAMAQSAPPASGTSPPKANAQSTEEITVTAQKRSQSINSVGLTIQAATAVTLNQRGITSPADLGKLVPGFTFTQSLYATPVFTLRGIGLYDATFGASPSVAIYTDQIPRNFPVMSEALDLDLARVEVLKGPQGTLFGQSATGGAINYITAKPTPQFHAGIDASYQSYGKSDISGFVSGPLTDTLSARLALRTVNGGAWQFSESRPGNQNGATRKVTGRLTVDWKPTDRLSVEASATLDRDDSDPQAPQYVGSEFNTYSASALAAADANPATRNPYGVVNNALYAGITTPGSPNYDSSFLGRQATLVGRLNTGDPEQMAAAQAILGTPLASNNARAAEWTPGLLGPAHNSYYQMTLRGDYKLTDQITLTSISALARQELHYPQDLDATTAQAVDVHLFGNVRTFNQEVRLSGNGPRLNWIAGGTVDDDHTEQSNYFDLADYSGNAPIPGIPPISLTLNQFSSHQQSYGAFGNAEYKITPQLSAVGGVRYTENDLSASYCYNDPKKDTGQGAAQTFSIFQDLFTGSSLPEILPGQCFPLGDGKGGTTFGKATLSPVNEVQNEGNWSYRFGLNYKLDNGTLLYSTISQGFKGGIFSAIGASSTSQYTPAKQEKVVAYEAGFKAPLLDHHLQFNAAGFYYDYSDKQVRGRIADPIYGLLEKLVNVPKSYVWGIEAELVVHPIEGLTLSGSGTYLKSDVSADFATANGAPVYNAAGYTGNFKGSALPYTPTYSANADAEYAWALPDGLRPFVGGTLVYQGEENATFANSTLPANDFKIGSYATADFRAGVGSGNGNWQITAYGRNVFNRTYTTSVTTYLDTRFRFTGLPAIYGVSLSYRY